MSSFSMRKLKMLSPEAEDWDNLVEAVDFQKQNSVYGVILYPNKDFDADEIKQEIQQHIEKSPTLSHGKVEVLNVKERENNWAIVYQISDWYNHFNLTEKYD